MSIQLVRSCGCSFTICPISTTGLYPQTDSSTHVKTKMRIVESTVLTPNRGPSIHVPMSSSGMSMQMA